MEKDSDVDYTELMPRLRMRLCSEILAAHLDFDS
jgi:hypothetical protein